MVDIRAALTAVVAGDVGALNVILGVPQDQILEVAKDMELILTRETLAGVLRRMGGREIDGTEVQLWASFMRRGFIEGRHCGPVKPIDVDYQSWYEQEIADIISRLDEIGDVVDGEVPGPAEIADYLALLGVADIG